MATGVSNLNNLNKTNTVASNNISNIGNTMDNSVNFLDDPQLGPSNISSNNEKSVNNGNNSNISSITTKQLSKKLHKRHNKPIKCVTHTPYTQGSLQWQISWDAIEMQSITGKEGVIQSIPFDVGGHTWTIELYPNFAQHSETSVVNRSEQQTELQTDSNHNDGKENLLQYSTKNVNNSNNNSKKPLFSQIANTIARASLPLPINNKDSNSNNNSNGNFSESVALLPKNGNNNTMSSFATPTRFSRTHNNHQSSVVIHHSQPREKYRSAFDLNGYQNKQHKQVSSNINYNSKNQTKTAQKMVIKQQSKFHLFVQSTMTPFRAKVAVYYAKSCKNSKQHTQQQRSSKAQMQASNNDEITTVCSPSSLVSMTDEEDGNDTDIIGTEHRSGNKSKKYKLKWCPIYITKIIKFEENGAFCDKLVDYNILASLVYHKKIRLRIVVKVFDEIQTQCLKNMTAQQLIRQNLQKNNGLWQNNIIKEPASIMSSILFQLFESNTLTDTLLIINNISENNDANIENNRYEIACHSCILAAFSKKFEQMIICEKNKLKQLKQETNWKTQQILRKQQITINKLTQQIKNYENKQNQNESDETPMIQLEKRDSKNSNEIDLVNPDIPQISEIHANSQNGENMDNLELESNINTQNEINNENVNETTVNVDSINIDINANQHKNTNDVSTETSEHSVSSESESDSSIDESPANRSGTVGAILEDNEEYSPNRASLAPTEIISQNLMIDSNSNVNSVDGGSGSDVSDIVDISNINLNEMNRNVDNIVSNINNVINDESNEMIVLHLGSQWDINLIKLMLKYIYCEEIALFSETSEDVINKDEKSIDEIKDILTKNTTLLFDLMLIADYFQVERLVVLCLQRLSIILDTLGTNMLNILVWTEKYSFIDGVSDLEDQCLQYLVANLADITQTAEYEAFTQSRPEILKKIMSHIATTRQY